jgi:isochorismate hydrolase
MRKLTKTQRVLLLLLDVQLYVVSGLIRCVPPMLILIALVWMLKQGAKKP